MLSARSKGLGPGGLTSGNLKDLLAAPARGAKVATGGLGNGDMDAMVKAILQESGFIGMSRKGGPKKKRLRKVLAADKPGAVDPLDRVRAQRQAVNNIHQLAAATGISGDDVTYVERQFSQVKRIVDAASQKLQSGYTQLVGDGFDDTLSSFTSDDASLLLLFVGIELGEQAFNDICATAEIQGGSPSREEKQINQEEVGPPLDFKTWSTGILAWLRQHLMAGVLAERRGEIKTQFLDSIAQSTAVKQLNSTVPPPAAPQPPSYSLNQPAKGGFSDPMEMNASYVSYLTSTSGLRPPAASELFDDSLLQGSTTRSVRIQVYGKVGSRRPSVSDKLGGASTIGPGSSIMHQSSVLQGLSQMSQTSSASVLPPLRLKQKLRDATKKKSLMDNAGFNASFSRGTPRCLRDELSPGGKTIEMLRRELRMAQEGLTQLNTMVDQNIVWVHKNTDVVGLSGGSISTRARGKCHKMAVERLVAVFGGALLSAQHWALLRWRRACQYDKVTALAKQYSRIKAIEITTRTLYEVMTRQFLRGWAPWLRKMHTEQRWEQEASATEIQRVVRAFCGRRRFKRMRRFQASLRVQCMFRCFKARRRVRMRRAYLRIFRAAKRIQWLFKNYLLRRKAKREVARRKKLRAQKQREEREKQRVALTRAEQKRKAEEDEKARKVKELEDMMKDEKRDPRYKGRAPPGKKERAGSPNGTAKPGGGSKTHFVGAAGKQVAAQKAKLAEEAQKKKAVVDEETLKHEADKRRREEERAAKAAEDAARRARLEAEKARLAEEASAAAAEAARAALFKEELDKSKPASGILGSVTGLMGSLLGGNRSAQAPSPIPATSSPNLAATAEVSDDVSVTSSITAATGFSKTLRKSFEGITGPNGLFGKRASTPEAGAARATTPVEGKERGRVPTPTNTDSPTDAAEKKRIEREEKEERDRVAAEEKARAVAEAAEKKRLEKEEKDRLAAEAAEKKRLEKEEKDRLAAEEKERKRLEKEEKDRLAAEEKERQRLEKEERNRIASEEKERQRLEKEEQDRVAKETATETAERHRIEKEEKAKLAAEEKERLRLEKEEKDRIAAEEKARAAAETARIAAEEKERLRAEKEVRDRIAAEEKAKAAADAARAAAEEKAKSTAEAAEKKRIEREEKEERDRVAAEEKARAVAEAAEKKRLEKEEKDRLAAEAAEKKRLEKEEKDRLAAEEKERKRLEKEALAASKPQTPGGGMFGMFSRPSTAAAPAEAPSSPAKSPPKSPKGAAAAATAAAASPERPNTASGGLGGMFSSMLGKAASGAATTKDAKAAAASKKKSNKKSSKSKGPPPSADEAVLRLQLFARVWKAKKRIKTRRDQVRKEQTRCGQLILWSVVLIQSIARMRQGRIRWNNFWAIYQKELAARRLYSSILVQKTARGYNARKRVKRLWKEHAEKVKADEWKKYQAESGRRTKQKAKEIEDAEKAAGIKASSRAAPTAEETEANPMLLYGGIDIEQVKEIDDKIARMEELERRLAEKEASMLEQARKAEERQVALERTLKAMEDRAKADEAERAIQKELLTMAAGPISSGRSPYSSARGAVGPNSGRGPMSSARPSARDAPPSARSARGGAGIPPDAPKVTLEGQVWVQLWDPDEHANYWYCEKTQQAQWEEPGKPPGYESGYESSGAMTDYSTDHYTSGGSVSGSEWGEGESDWQEFWDESAQAKYWYNNSTGEATWTKPPELDRNSAINSVPASARSSAASAMDWVSYIDEGTGQEYWYNAKTGETNWA